MSLKSKFSTFTAAYKSALKNNSNDEWSEAGKGITAKDTFSTIGKGLAFISIATTKSYLSLHNASASDRYEEDEYNNDDGYRMGHSGYGYYSGDIKIHD
ncbi:hypothetical protein E4T80_11830 [Muribacter muris]|uniref:Uncharacterized protein n=1 Tax=Muribacter muris TaxID=67855 RepID=A0A4Y9JQ35_9PAST|nr:hypothetical protein [Muribacter muris]MBF0786149.1 hypothetical protein [Muribacter muris]MBF0827330.1 hypothetical protein [Muribacter muris]TFV07821.1 hypothetical protein E4T80_11830 [Muribacter muris]